MQRKVAIGIQSFEKLREEDYFYVDKTAFIKEWWERGDSVTLIMRPYCFGKTLNMSMLETFFSIKYANRGDLFENLCIWQEEKYQKMQGTYPVISLSLASIKSRDYKQARYEMIHLIVELYSKYNFIFESEVLKEINKDFVKRVSFEMNDADITFAIHQLCGYLYQYYGKKVIILLDAFDIPMKEAYRQGYWDEWVSFTRSMFHSMFKGNPYLERGMMVGITSISQESIFSDLNNVKFVTMTSNEYANSFGFTEEEVLASLEEYDLEKEKERVKQWYGGFSFGTYKNIYNPLCILKFLRERMYKTYWADVNSNGLIDKIIREGNSEIKELFEDLLNGKVIRCEINERFIYKQLDSDENAIWSFLLTRGYLKVLSYERIDLIGDREVLYDLVLTNDEVKSMFFDMVQKWFGRTSGNYYNFIGALLRNDIEEMNIYMNRITRDLSSYFGIEKRIFRIEMERFYHGFVLGLLTKLVEDYVITSNGESGYGKYDVMLEPKDKRKKAFILEFKIHEPEEESSLQETVAVALKQIEEMKYATDLIARGCKKENIRKYGFALGEKEVLIGE